MNMTSDMKSFLKGFHHSRHHIVWNFGDFFMDNFLLNFSRVQERFLKTSDYSKRRSHRDSNQVSEEAMCKKVK